MPMRDPKANLPGAKDSIFFAHNDRIFAAILFDDHTVLRYGNGSKVHSKRVQDELVEKVRNSYLPPEIKPNLPVKFD
jgi:hypothetical protein